MGFFSWAKKQVKKITKPFVRGVKKIVKGVGDFFTGVANFVGSLFGYNMNPDPGDYNIQGQQGTTVNKTGGDVSIPLVFGKNLPVVGGHLVHMSNSGDSNQFLHLTYVVGHGGVNRITVTDNEYQEVAPGAGIAFADFTTNNGPNNFDSSGNDFFYPTNSGSVTKEDTMHYVSGQKSFTRVWFDNGSPRAKGNRYTTADFHNDKTVYKGLATVKLMLEWPKDLDAEKYNVPFTGMPNFTFNVNRSPGHRATTGQVDDTHPVNILYDLLRNKTYGLGLEKIYIDEASFDALYAETIWEFTQSTYRFDTSAPVVENIKSLLYAMDCTLIWRDNKFYVKPSPNSANVKITTNSNYNITTHTVAEQDCIGGVAYEIPSEDKKYKLFTLEYIPIEETVQMTSELDTDLVFYKNMAPAIKNKLDLNARAVNTQAIVGLANLRLADTKLIESHYGSVVSLALGAKHSNIEANDIIDVTYARANLSSAKYVVLDVEHTNLETVNVRAIRYLYDNDAEGLTPRDILVKLPTHTLFKQNDGTLSKNFLAVPTGFGIDSNTQIDQFLPQARIPSTLDTLKVTTSNEFFKKVIDNKGRPSFINRIRLDWTIVGSPNNTRYAVSIKKLGDQKFDRLFETNELFAFVDNLEDLAIYYVRVTPINQSGYGVGRVNRFTTLDSSGPDITNSNKEFLVTDENGEGDGVQTTGSGPENDTYADAVNIFSSSYTTRTNRPFGKSPDNFLLTTETGFEETYKQLLAPTDKIGKCWNDFDYSANGGSGSRSDGFAKIESTDQLSPDYTDSDYPSATEANFNARIGTWGGTAWTALANYRAANGDDAAILGQSFRSCIWLSSPNNRAVTVSSFEMPCMAGGTEDTGYTGQDHWFEGKVEVAPDQTTSGHTSGDNVFYSQPNCFVYMYASDTNDNVTTFPFKKNTSGNGPFPQFTGILTNWNTSSGDSRVFDSGAGGFSAQLMTGVDMSTYSESSYNSGTKSKALPINEGRYVTPILMFPLGRFFGIRNYNFKIKTEQSIHTFKNIDTSSLSGSTAARTFTWTNPRFGRIKNVQISTNNASSSNIVGYLTADPVDNTQSITFKCIQTDNGSNVDARVDITISGYPEVKHIAHTDTLGNTKYIEYKSNFEGTL